MAAAAGFLQTMCRKTKMCKYYAHGRCTRRQNCDFAHSMDELRPVPDLSCTKVCPRLICAGRCDDSSCAFAHAKGELRKVRLASTGRPADAASRSQGARAGARRPSSSLSCDAEVSSSPTLSADAFINSPLLSPHTAPNEGLQRQYSSSSSFNEEAGLAELPPSPSGVPEAFQGKSRREHQSKVDAAGGHKPPPGWDWGAKFHKTALCAFHRQGKCNKGSACHFAHGEEELVPLPNLFRTKLCMRLLSTGSCTDPTCRYAHSREELRCRPSSLDQGAMWDEEGEDEEMDELLEAALAPVESGPEVEAPATPSQPAEDVDIKLSVKNTFLTIEDEDPLYLPPRAKTQPHLVSEQEDSSGLCATPENLRKAKSWPVGEVPSGLSSDSLFVKNTFLTIEELPPMSLPPKARTQPDLPGAASEDEEEEEATPWKRQETAPARTGNPGVMLEELPPKMPSAGAQSFPEVALDGAEVLVKNTFLTIEEPNDLCLPSKAKSSPVLSKVLAGLRLDEDAEEEAAEDGAATEDSHGPPSSTEDSASPAPSWGSAARRLKESTILDSVDLPLGLSDDVTALIKSEGTAVVPVCAIQQVSQLPEEPEMAVEDVSFALPAINKVLLKPGGLAAQGEPSRASKKHSHRVRT